MGSLLTEMKARFLVLPLWVRVTLILVVLVVITSIGQAITGGGKTSTPIVVASSTSTPAQATVTRVPASATGIQDATLGGTVEGFITAYGAPAKIDHNHYSYDLTRDGHDFEVTIIPEENGHVWYLRVGPTSSSVKWSPDTGQALSKLFLPNDARYQHNYTMPSGSVEQVYLSNALATSVKASDFTNSDTGDAVPPGTLAVACGSVEGLDTSSGGCIITTGE
jgi:hypothetical protein